MSRTIGIIFRAIKFSNSSSDARSSLWQKLHRPLSARSSACTKFYMASGNVAGPHLEVLGDKPALVSLLAAFALALASPVALPSGAPLGAWGEPPVLRATGMRRQSRRVFAWTLL